MPSSDRRRGLVGYKLHYCELIKHNQCPSCPFGGLDFSRGLFAFFAPESEGEIHGSWTFGSGDPPKPKPTETPQPEPSTTTHKPSTTTTTTSHLSISSTSSMSISSTTSSTSTTATSTPTGTDVAVPTEIIAQFYLIMVNMGGLTVAAGSA